jgi:4-diphosphocytidyl-2-C-methyl-D-erythritol kinase
VSGRGAVAARVIAQAKINLRLCVLAREASGYHGIETIFQRLDWGDEITVRLASGRSLDCGGAAMPTDGLGPTERNLAYRAALAYADAVGWPSGFAIEIDKRVPVGGGLGGGSADAGAVLRALDALSPRPLGERLVELATELGSDVPFLATEHPIALGWGRGERLMPLPALPSRPVMLLVPEFSVATGDAYAWLATARGGYAPAADVIAPSALATWDGVATIATNDFERVVGQRHHAVPELVDELASFGASIAMLSGSGSTVFGIFDTAPDAGAIARSTRCTVVATRTSERVVGVSLVG